MSLYLEQIRQLVSLQKVDDDIHTITLQVEKAPKEVDELTTNFATLNTQRDHILEKLEHLNEQAKRLNAEIEDDSARIKKSKSKLMQVANTREYQAMSREMDNMEKMNRNREEERAALSEELQLQKANLEEVNEQWNVLKADLETKQAGLNDRLAVWQKDLAKLTTTRKSTDADVPKPVLSRYEFIRRRLPHPVIVPVTAGICSACHIGIPPQIFIDLQGGHKIINCPNCQRLIYWSEHFQAPEKAADKAEKAAQKAAEKAAEKAVEKAIETESAE